jgi:periplasmic protein TonB
MTEHVMARPPLDDPWGRLVWIVPAALALWIAMIAAFSLVLGQRDAPPPPALEAQLIELPPPPPPISVGLKGGGGAKPAAPAVHKPVRPPAPSHHVQPAPKIVPHENTPKVALPPETTTPPVAAGGEANPGASEGSESGASNGSEGGEGSGGSGEGVGPGSDSGGARAIVAPKPVIPDDLREEAMNVVAVARFTVSSDGEAHVTLIKPTRNPRLNEILLNTLAKWQFFPAVRNGEPVDSTIDIRIPITVQ